MMELKDDQVIVAQATPQGAGAIAMLRVSGTRAVEFVDAVSQLPGSKKLVDQTTHTIHYGWMLDEYGQHLDQVLFLLMRAPRTFTGQDVVEITCHNNQFLVEQIIERIITAGARLAQSGEFTRRAVLHDKLDLVQAEAINELISAQTSQAVKQSLRQLEGSFSSWIAGIEKQLIMLVGLCEASFEFLDEEISFAPQIIERLAQVRKDITQLLVTFDKRHYITQGVRIALVGSVNAGKSSLFNALIARKRAIVTDIAGTTRDTIEAGVYSQGAFLTFVDTAGLRASDDVVEQMGIDRSFQEVASSDLILLVFDATANYSVQEIEQYRAIVSNQAHKTIFVQNKIDAGSNLLPFLTQDQVISVAAGQLINIDQLRARIDEKINQLLQVQDMPCLLNKRQYNLLFALDQSLEKIEQRIAVRVDYELLAVALRDAIEQLCELTGKTVSEQALDAIFRDFCVGK